MEENQNRETDGVHFAQELCGNVAIKEIFRYAKPVHVEMGDYRKSF
ncbi:hypothetical protein [Fluoribacter gormanii]|uniref:Uncharacterized protein n=1 Tax=Fluoribacter gormanii TaxID=464 RepID=A0A377GIS5_9GAMM|nr:hypothetical protein [Fluoribacter gormanii]SIR90382.1 hypothetical protein SAMN05421777_1402 [Fluoribacter gormanii]STO24272.1 Uncharacterised protein [Fluoribacter gormanii]